MMFNSKAILVAASLALVAFQSPVQAADFPEGSPKFKTSYQAVAEEVKTSKKPRVVVYSAPWCGPCFEMKKTVYPSPDIKAFHDKFEWVYVDIDDKANAPLVLAEQVNSIPRIDIVSPEGKKLAQEVGQVSVKQFSKLLLKGLSQSKG